MFSANAIADSLSSFLFQKFRSLAPHAPNASYSIFSTDIQLGNPALIPLISKSQSSIINSLSPSTLFSYWTAWKSFHHFHDRYNITLPSVNLITLTSFITYAHSIMAIKTHTIKAYLSGISFFSKLITGSSGLAPSHPQVTSLLKGLLCQEPAKNPCHFPLTTDLLSICLHTICTALLKSPKTCKPCSC